ncbi:MAG: SLC13 family permease [Thermoanaerobaculia bacterium]|nr:SLC13 family permease [Thermoanaerobaculia bacterium]
MTLEIATLFALLVGMVYLFLTEKLPVELTAFLGLLILIFGGYVSVDEAFVGFSSPAVITMFSIFFISAALLQTGVADVVGRRITRLSGGKEIPLIILLMTVAGVMSAFMNNVAAAAVMLPAVSAIARHANLSPSKLFMPLSFGAILGGTTTLVGTPPNILTGEMIQNAGLEPIHLFDFTPIGLVLLGVGIVFMITVGRKMLPDRAPVGDRRSGGQLTQAYRIEERLTTIRIPRDSNLDGSQLRESKLGTALDVAVLAVRRGEKKFLAPPPDFRLEADDLVLVDGQFDELRQLMSVQGVAVQEPDPGHLAEISQQIHGVVLQLPRGSGLVGRSLRQLHFRDRFGVLVVGIRRGDQMLRQELARRVLRDTDEVMVLGTERQIEALSEQKGLKVASEVPVDQVLAERMFILAVPQGSRLSDATIRDSRLGELAGLTIIGIVRNGEAILAVPGDEVIHGGDELLVAGDPDRILDVLDLGDLELEDESTPTRLESESVRVVEAVVAPRSKAAGSTLRRLHFRDRYGLQVLAIGRGGETIHKELANLPLRFGDALLIQGSVEKIGHLAEDDDFLVLTHDANTPRRVDKAPVALGALALMIVLVAGGLFPIHVAAFAGAVTAVLFGALKMEEAYRAIEWRAIYLVAAILPVGLAMESSGAADLLAGGVTRVAEAYGPYAFIASLVLLSSMLSQGLDGAPTVVILAPVVLRTAENLAISPYPLLMAVGFAASAAFMTPFSHKANLLVMGAGGYRSMDFVRVGTPLTLVVLALLVVLVPLFFPFGV